MLTDIYIFHTEMALVDFFYLWQARIRLYYTVTTLANDNQVTEWTSATAMTLS